MTPLPAFAPDPSRSLPLWLLRPGGDGPDWPEAIPATARTWARAQGFAGKPGQVCVYPGPDGALSGALFGIGAERSTSARPARERYPLAKAAEALPAGDWYLANTPEGFDAALGALGWLFAQYRFARYKKAEAPAARLVCPAGVDAERILALVAGEYLARDLINTPASDMGPEDLENAASELAARHGAEISVIRGDDLLSQNFPMIHAVGRAGVQPPRLIDLRFPGEGPMLTLVGKGVCFDTGGLDIKPPSSMALMKKDMGGAANVLGLAETLARLGLTRGMRLRVLIPAVENAIAGNAFRPGDILTSRKGLTVEVNNTDAEGRLVLADALAFAEEEGPALLISMATLTGAARVALGPDLPPFFCDDDRLADALSRAGRDHADPVWRMPFWEPYEAMIEPAIADLDNAPGGGFAGAITAALFLRRFTAETTRYVHFDIYGWQPSAAPGRSKGGTGQAMRAILNALPEALE
ncbi:MAG TPA: leucyl aminopeptidase family protein [Paracoccus sp. (in: a-proteobacteria)]|uniref:leucyl aminopeptidase family protein n=1 Tax=Paracoccus sp. TaxID=267 RepID=UPI002CDBC2B4|nr:leucyl aminopeptidase family protein [Paracoccus sp. (in: a-proteobacteria)]HWL56221.1 leucyl aminopeptidase family protein [Paracoccus sp. (in: a-proteobacteria)]